MTRRDLIKRFALTAAGLYVPTRTFFLPPDGGWGCNYLYDGGYFFDPRFFGQDFLRSLKKQLGH